MTLSNGTWASIKYYADKRVESVEVAPNGANAKTTHFHYEDGPPRRSIVSPLNKPQITYDIGADGSVFKWWHKDSPPEIIALNGSLGFDKNGKEVAAGDLVLEVEGDSPHGVASIQIIANGNQLVSEKTCEQDPDPEIECERLEDLWVTDTASLAPGVLNIEVIVTNELERSESKRWWVTIPHTPPPVPGYPVPPKFSEIQKFREDYGLEVVFPVANERELVERIFNLINAWHSPQTPAGEVARASWERWGVPLRPVDVAELEYRQAYVEQAGLAIPAWASGHAPTTYSGYYVDHRSGGKILIGFTQNQEANVEALKGAGLMAPDRIAAFPSVPQRSYSELLSAQHKIATHAASLASFTQAPIDVKGNTLRVGTTSTVESMMNALTALLGAGAPVTAFVDTNPPGANDRGDRDRLGGRVQAGDAIRSDFKECTANFGTSLEHLNLRGERVFKHFLLTAGHCGDLDEKFYREKFNPKSGFQEAQTLGKVRRQGIEGDAKVDAMAILLQGSADAWAPRQIYLMAGATQPVTGVILPTPGMLVSTSGVTTDEVKTGQVLGPPVLFTYTNYAGLTAYEVPIAIRQRGGDSGAPVWQAGTGNAVGLWNAGTEPSFVTPLLPYPVTVENNPGGVDFSPGALAKLGFGPQNVSIAR